MYDFLIIGSGLFGAVFAHEAHSAGKRVLMLERRSHVGGNIYCEEKEGIRIHKYGAHIFHTSDREVWDYVNRFVLFNNYINSPVANYRGELYNLPFNMNTFAKMWGVTTPAEAAAKIEEQRRAAGIKEPQNLEEQAISLIGTDIYTKLIKGYTEKQWGRSCTELPAFIIRRLPVRYTFDNNYFNDRYQGIPVGGYNRLIHALLDGIEVRTGEDYNLPAIRERYRDAARTIVYTGAIDAYFGYALGTLAYRGLRFETERLEEENGTPARKPTIPSTTPKTKRSIPVTPPWQKKKTAPSSAAASRNIATTIWTTSFGARSTARVPPSPSTQRPQTRGMPSHHSAPAKILLELFTCENAPSIRSISHGMNPLPYSRNTFLLSPLR